MEEIPFKLCSFWGIGKRKKKPCSVLDIGYAFFSDVELFERLIKLYRCVNQDFYMKILKYSSDFVLICAEF